LINAELGFGFIPTDFAGKLAMGEGDWKEEQRKVLARLLDSTFKRREASVGKKEADIDRRAAAIKQPDVPHSPNVTSPDPPTGR
jgi:hypothetical protein